MVAIKSSWHIEPSIVGLLILIMVGVERRRHFHPGEAFIVAFFLVSSYIKAFEVGRGVVFGELNRRLLIRTMRSDLLKKVFLR